MLRIYVCSVGRPDYFGQLSYGIVRPRSLAADENNLTFFRSGEVSFAAEI